MLALANDGSRLRKDGAVNPQIFKFYNYQVGHINFAIPGDIRGAGIGIAVSPQELTLHDYQVSEINFSVTVEIGVTFTHVSDTIIIAVILREQAELVEAAVSVICTVASLELGRDKKTAHDPHTRSQVRTVGRGRAIVADIPDTVQLLILLAAVEDKGTVVITPHGMPAGAGGVSHLAVLIPVVQDAVAV
jgi:hypothetical protein